MNIGKLISKVAGGSASELVKTVAGVVDEFKLSPEEKLQLEQKLTEELNRHNEAMVTAANDLEKAYLADSANARDNNARIQESDKASWWAKNTAYFLDIFVGLIWGAITIFLVAKALKLADSVQADMTAVLSIYSTVTAIFMISMNFHRGSSVGSKANGDALRAMIKKKE